MPPHDHDYCEVCLILGGTGWHLTRDYRRPVRRGDILLAAPGEVHAFEPGRGLRAINLYYLSEWLLRDARDFGEPSAAFSLFFARGLFRSPLHLPMVQFRIGSKETALCERELLDIVAANGQAAPSLPFLRATLTKFMILAADACPAQELEIYAGFRPEVWDAVRRIERQVAEGRPLNMQEIRQGANLGSFHLARLFKRETGWTPSAYYQFRRIQLAGARLLDGQPTVTEVAMECGYADASHLGRNFRRFLGTTPRAYRNYYDVRETRDM